MAEHGIQQLCFCREKLYGQSRKKRTSDRCRRKRQAFVFNPEEEIWHEPYMQTLRREFSDESVLCDSKIELPWRDIALPITGMRIRPDVTLTPTVDRDAGAEVIEEVEIGGKRESTGIMTLPWQDLLITDNLRTRAAYDTRVCDSSVEIPWRDLVLEKPMEIRPPKEEKACTSDDVEIPWDEILVPPNIIIESDKRKEHPSSKRPPRAHGGVVCAFCGTYPCCSKASTGTKRTSCV